MVYAFLMSTLASVNKDKFQWEVDFNEIIFICNWKNIHEFGQKFTLNVATKENAYKIQQHCYFTME